MELKMRPHTSVDDLLHLNRSVVCRNYCNLPADLKKLIFFIYFKVLLVNIVAIYFPLLLTNYLDLKLDFFISQCAFYIK